MKNEKVIDIDSKEVSEGSEEKKKFNWKKLAIQVGTAVGGFVVGAIVFGGLGSSDGDDFEDDTIDTSDFGVIGSDSESVNSTD